MILLKNLEAYTNSTFSQRVSKGLESSLQSILGGSWVPWKWSIEDDETAPSGTDDLSMALRQSLWDNWIVASVQPVNGPGAQNSTGISTGPSNSERLTDTDEHISTAATSLEVHKSAADPSGPLDGAYTLNEYDMGTIRRT